MIFLDVSEFSGASCVQGRTGFRGSDCNLFTRLKNPLTTYMINQAAIHPKCSLCCFRAMVMLLVASCLVLRVSCVSRALAGFMVFLVGPLVFLGCLAAGSGV